MHFGIKLQRSYIITKTTQHIFSCSAARNSRYQLPAEVQCPCRRSLLLFFFQLVAVLLLKCCNALLLAHTHTHIYTCNSFCYNSCKRFFFAFFVEFLVIYLCKANISRTFCFAFLLISPFNFILHVLLLHYTSIHRFLMRAHYVNTRANAVVAAATCATTTKSIHDRMSSTMQNLLTKVSY